MVDSNDNKKILYVITKSNFGGAQRYVYDIATNLHKKGFDITVAMGISPADIQGEEGGLKKRLDNNKIKTITINNLSRDINVFDDLVVFFNLLKLFKKEKPDVVHLNSSKIGGIGALAARFARIPRIIFTAHGWAFNEARSPLKRLAIKFFSWVTVFLCHQVITVSEYDGQQGRTMPFVNKKITIIHNGISEITFLKKNEVRNKLLGWLTPELDEKTVWLGTIAELHKNKGLEIAIKAISRITKDRPSPADESRSFVFVIIGDGEERKNLEKLIKKERITDKVFLVGHQDNASSLLGAFDIFILPSVKEGLPYVILEAGKTKLPIIASSIGGIPEIIEDMKSGILIKPKNPNEIAEAIIYLIKNKKKMDEFGKMLHEKVVKEFSIDQMIQKTMRVYIS